MASTVASPQITAAITATLTGGAAPATVSGNVNHTPSETPTVGSSSGNVNKAYSVAGTVTSGSPVDIDLTAVTDPLGASLNFSQVHAILLENLSTTAGQDLTLGAGTNPLLAASTQLAYAGTAPGFVLQNCGTTGITVDSTHKTVRVAVAAGTGVGYKLTIIGK
jgi:hypothetical protein